MLGSCAKNTEWKRRHYHAIKWLPVCHVKPFLSSMPALVDPTFPASYFSISLYIWEQNSLKEMPVPVAYISSLNQASLPWTPPKGLFPMSSIGNPVANDKACHPILFLLLPHRWVLLSIPLQVHSPLSVI